MWSDQSRNSFKSNVFYVFEHVVKIWFDSLVVLPEVVVAFALELTETGVKIGPEFVLPSKRVDFG